MTAVLGTYLAENFCLLDYLRDPGTALSAKTDHGQRRFFHDILALGQCVSDALDRTGDSW